MDLRRSDQILALKSARGDVIGFHSSNLEIAELTEELWQTFLDPSFDLEAFEQLNAWNNEISTEVKSESTPTQIRSLSINVTQICNLQCVYCAAGGDGTYGSAQKQISVEKTLPQVALLLNRLSEGETFNVTFLGGEPLLYPLGMQLIAEFILEKAEEKNIKVAFNTITNGTLLNAETISVLKSFRSNITLSLDGPPEINDLVRPSKRSSKSDVSGTELILKGLQLALENRESLGSIGIQGVFGPYNPDALRAYHFYETLNVDWYDFHFDQECADSEASQKFAAQLTEAGRRALEAAGEKGLRKIKFFDQIFGQLDRKTRVENFCGSGKSYVVLDAQNKAFTCPWTVNEPKLAVGSGTDLLPEKLQPLKKTLLSANNCQDCWARYLCGGGCMWAHRKATGHQHQVDPVYCERTRSLISTAISYYYQLRKV